MGTTATTSSKFYSFLLLLFVACNLVTASPIANPDVQYSDLKDEFYIIESSSNLGSSTALSDEVSTNAEQLTLNCQTQGSPLEKSPTIADLQRLFNFLQSEPRWRIGSREMCDGGLSVLSMPGTPSNAMVQSAAGKGYPWLCEAFALAVRNTMQKCEYRGYAWGWGMWFGDGIPKSTFTITVKKAY